MLEGNVTYGAEVWKTTQQWKKEINDYRNVILEKVLESYVVGEYSNWVTDIWHCDGTDGHVYQMK